MTKVQLKFKDDVLKEISLDRDLVTIGRKPDNDIHVDNLAVSGYHAKILKEGEWFVIEDMDSLNGTFVNGRRIQKCPLKNGDEVLIGKHVLKFISTDVPKTTEPPTIPKKGSMGETMVIDSKVQQEMLVQTRRDKVAAGPGEGVGGFMVLEGSTDKKEYDLTERVVTIGKDKSAKIRLKGFFAPKVAALINRKKEGYFISSAGKDVRVNGDVISKTHQLKDGDIVEVAGIKLHFFMMG